MQLGFLPITVWDIIDILIVGFLIYQIYRLLKGSVAFNIFIGVVLLYLFWWLVKALDMELLSLILGQFVSVGVIILIIIFQPEVRKFLLYLGDTTLKRRSKFFQRLFTPEFTSSERIESQIKAIQNVLAYCSQHKLGALIVVSKDFSPSTAIHSGIELDAKIEESLLKSIFQKKSPLHDGAVLIRQNRIAKAKCILPVSQKENLPSGAGLRHRAALGISESATVGAIIVSEETGLISYADEGVLHYEATKKSIADLLRKYL